MHIALRVRRFRQSHRECGPAALKQSMEFLRPGKIYDIKELISETKSELKYLDWNYKLGIAALKRGFGVTVYSASTDLYDPTWKGLSMKQLVKKLERRLYFIKHAKKKDIMAGYVWWWYRSSLEAAIEFLKAGGIVKIESITKELLIGLLKRGTPPITPVNGSLVYGMKRAYFRRYNDVKGEYFGHIFMVSGYDGKKFVITDPEKLSDRTKGIIKIDENLLLNSILTHTAEILSVS